MITSFFSYGQEEDMGGEKKESSKPKHEVRIISENIFGGNESYLYYNPLAYGSSYSAAGMYEYLNNKFKYGVGYNFNLKKIGIRTKAFYNSFNETYSVQNQSENTSNSNMLRVSLGLNYQKELNNVTLFFGADLTYFNVGIDQYQSYNENSLYLDSYSKISYGGFGIEPVVGFNYFLSEHFSFSSEIRIIIDSYKGESENSNTYNGGFTGAQVTTETNNADFEGINKKIGPNGSISLNVHF
jgi:hypothetical protein